MFNLFGSNKQEAAPPQQNTQPTASGQNVPSPADQATKDGKMPGTDQSPVNPLDAYAKLWETSASSPEVAPSFTLDPKVLDDVSGKLNFMSGMDPELVQKATSGDVNALMQMMNQVGQSAYKASLAHGSALTDKFVGARSKFDLEGVSSKVKSELTQSHMSDIPNAGHPAVKAELVRISKAMQKEHPDASPQQIAEAAKTYFKDIYSAMNPEPTAQQKQATAGETDWDNFFDK